MSPWFEPWAHFFETLRRERGIILGHPLGVQPSQIRLVIMSSPSFTPRSSFLVRFWREPHPFFGDEQGVWRAYVQHIDSGESAHVETTLDLIAFFEKWMGPLASDASINITHTDRSET